MNYLLRVRISVDVSRSSQRIAYRDRVPPTKGITHVISIKIVVVRSVSRSVLDATPMRRQKISELDTTGEEGFLPYFAHLTSRTKERYDTLKHENYFSVRLTPVLRRRPESCVALCFDLAVAREGLHLVEV